jgi:hypothetical protein
MKILSTGEMPIIIKAVGEGECAGVVIDFGSDFTLRSQR